MPLDIQDELRRAVDLHRAGRLGDARAIYQAILAEQPRHFDGLYLSALASLQLGEHQASLERFDRALEVNAAFAPAHHYRGLALKGLTRPADALASQDRALALKPGYADAHLGRGSALVDLGRLDEARQAFERAAAAAPGSADTHYRLGNVLKNLGRLQDAVASYGRALAIEPGHADAHNNLGNALRELGEPEKALQSYDRALSLRPGFVEVLNNRGNALKQVGRLEEALACYDAALALRPNYPEAHSNRGSVLGMLRRLDEALASHDRALSLRPDYPAAQFNRGNTLVELRRIEEAVAAYDKAAARLQHFAGFHVNRGNALKELKRYDEALASYRRALEIDPGHEFLLGSYLNAKMMLCDWDGLARDIEAFRSAILARRRVTDPFVALGLVDAPDLHRVAAELYADVRYPATAEPPAPSLQRSRERIRIGYYSADLHNHATAFLMAELFERHDPRRFEIHAFSYGPAVEDGMRRRLRAAFHRFVEVGTMTDAEVARLSRDTGIDIAVDLKGHTNGARPGIFAARCAPVQVSYLGYPGTMGARYIDYVVADRTVIPEAAGADYTEQVVRLPGSYQVNDSQREIADTAWSRAALGLPETGFVFCCFNNAYKILPATFDSWMRILGAVDGSVLWLMRSNATAARNLRREAESRGVRGDRLVFAGMMDLREHLARYRAADLVLDTWPYNAHTTASDALWAGVPVLTLAGRSFASRVAASLLDTVGLPELIVRTPADYEALAIALATQPHRLGALKARLAANRANSPLFDGALFARRLEAAFEAMQARAVAGLPPAPIEITPGGAPP